MWEYINTDIIYKIILQHSPGFGVSDTSVTCSSTSSCSYKKRLNKYHISLNVQMITGFFLNNVLPLKKNVKRYTLLHHNIFKWTTFCSFNAIKIKMTTIIFSIIRNYIYIYGINSSLIPISTVFFHIMVMCVHQPVCFPALTCLLPVLDIWKHCVKMINW